MVAAHFVFAAFGIPAIVGGPPMGEFDTTPWDVYMLVWSIGTFLLFPLAYFALAIIDTITKQRRARID